jgi:hypothetical protein
MRFIHIQTETKDFSPGRRHGPEIDHDMLRENLLYGTRSDYSSVLAEWI